MNNSTDGAFFSTERVVEGGLKHIEIRFQTLIDAKGDLPYTWYKEIGIDKSKASKIRRGLLIPFREWRIRIASYFGVDSSTIWTAEDIIGQEVSSGK